MPLRNPLKIQSHYMRHTRKSITWSALPKFLAEAAEENGIGTRAVARPRATPAPTSLPITDGLRQWAEAYTPGLHLGQERDDFLDYCRMKAITNMDWEAALQAWLRKAHRRGVEKGTLRPQTPIADVSAAAVPSHLRPPPSEGSALHVMLFLVCLI
jgi:hypothetical protein